jgi:hypothetical protein
VNIIHRNYQSVFAPCSHLLFKNELRRDGKLCEEPIENGCVITVKSPAWQCPAPPDGPSKIRVVTLRALTSAFWKFAVWLNGMK